MRRMVTRGLLPATALLLVTFCRVASAQMILNGGFENNGGAGTPFVSDWTSADQFGSADSFYVQTGTGSPVFGQTVPAPPAGIYAVMTDSGGAGSHVLYQDFVVPAGFVGPADLSFQVFINNQAGDFVAPTSLDFTAALNQQARIDLLTAASDPFSVAGSDVLLNLFQTNPGDPLISGYTLVSKNVSSLFAAHAGQTLRLRIAEVDNVNVLNFGVDAVRLTVAPSAVPEPGSLALGLLGGVGLLSALRRRRPRT